MTFASILKKNILYLAFFTALTGMLGSLYFSEIQHLAPCILCWYQRIALYALVLILGIGIWDNDRNVSRYALPFSVIGGLIGIYHNLLYYGVIPEQLAPCRLGVSCTQATISWFGFITIPLLSLTAFIVITSCLIISKRTSKD